MQPSALIAAVVSHTGGLAPSDSTTHAELGDLRRALIASLQSGQPVSDVGTPLDPAPGSPDLVRELTYLAGNPEAAAPGVSMRVVRRPAPVSLPPRPGAPALGAAAWTGGLKPSRTFGPFVDRAGRPWWFDVFTFSKPLEVRRAGAAADFLVLPAGVTVTGLANRYHIPAGTVWIASAQFTPSAPPATFVGLRVKSGTMTVAGLGGPADPLIVPAAAKVTLALVPDPSAPAGPAAGPGLDATNARADFPANVSFIFGPAGITAIGAEPAILKAYGSTIHLTRGAAPATYDAVVAQVLIPFAPDAAALAIAAVASPAFVPAGSAPITAAAWGFAVTPAAVVAAGATAGTGSLVVVATAGLSATWPGLAQGPVPLGGAYLEFDGSLLILFAPAASNLRANQSFDLWNDRALAGRCRLDVRYTRTFPFGLLSDRQGFDAVSAAGDAQALIDRPVTAGGARLQPELPAGLIVVQGATAMRLLLESSAPPDDSGRRQALALSNALITTSRTDACFATGLLATPTTLDAGSFGVVFRPYQILPALADPYAANFDALIRDAPVGGLHLAVTVTWPDPAAPAVAVALTPPPTPQQLAELLPKARPIRHGDTLLELFNHWVGGNALQQLALLDVSSNADQLGVAFGVAGPDIGNFGPPFTFDHLALTTVGANARAFLLPQFQWEPVTNQFNPLVPADPAGPLFSRNDGGPTLAGANSVTLVPIGPVSVTAEVVNAFAQEQRTASVLFTLPFGLQAVAGLDPANPDYLARPGLQLTAPDFGALRAARQLRLTAGKVIAPAGKAPHAAFQSYLEGRAQQTVNFAGQAPDNTLGPLAAPFNAAFGSRVPISRVDFSGYGATTFSRWFDATHPTVGITQVCFDGVNGRTAYERVEMTSVLWPCLATVVRTITVERTGNGAPVRWDSGWIATSDGRFAYPGVNTFHTGVVQGFFDVAGITDTDVFITLTDGSPLQAVYYDTNIAIAGVTRGAGASGRVPARRQLGYVQYIPASEQTAKILKPAAVKELLDAHGPLGGPIDCTLALGASQQEMRVTGVYAATAGVNPAGGALEYAVAVYGSPVLPAAGHWSVVKVVNTDRTVVPVDAGLGVPLVQQAAAALRWADPAQLFSANPDFDYGFLFSSEAQKILFPRLKVEPFATQITSAVAPLLADPYAQLNTSGLFPLLGQAIPFPSPNFGLANTGGALQLSPDPFPVPAPGRVLSLIDVDAWNDHLDYSDPAGAATQFLIKSAAGWTIDGSPLRQKLNFPLVGDIVDLVHEIHSPVDDVTSFPNPGFVFSGLLKPVTDVFSMLEQWMPDLPGPLKVSASFSGSTFQLSALADFLLADDDGNAIDVGIGKLSGELTAGANLSAELLKQTITGSVFLGITGAYQQEVFPEIYGGGQLAFRVSADQDGKTTLDFDANTVGSVGGDLIPGVVSVEATVKYGYWMQVVGGRVAPGIDVGMEGRAKLLDGLLGFKLGVEGRALITRFAPDPDHLCHLLGSILVSGSVQVAWVIDERKSWQANFDVNVGWKLLLVAAKSGLLPVP